MSLRVLLLLLGYTPTGCGDDQSKELLDGLITWLVRLDTWVETVVKCLTENEPGWALEDPLR